MPPPRHAMSAHCSRNTSIFCLPLPLCYPIICSGFPMHLACLDSHPDVFRFPAGPCFSSSDRPLTSVGILCCRNQPRQFGFLLVPNHILVLQTHLQSRTGSAYEPSCPDLRHCLAFPFRQAISSDRYGHTVISQNLTTFSGQHQPQLLSLSLSNLSSVQILVSRIDFARIVHIPSFERILQYHLQ